MAQLVIAAAGAAIGGALVPGVIGLGITGASAGWTIGSLIGSAFAPAQKSQGPRLNDLSVSSSAYGTPIPYVQGSPRLAGQIVWASTKREIATTTRQGGKGGGKQKVTTYTYEVDLLILLTDNIISGISRIWSNGKLVWNKSSTADAGTIAASDATAAWTAIRIYTGGPTQLPDTTYEAAVGTANAPAYRGRGSVFIQGLQLGQSGQIPNLTFEIDGLESGDHEPGDGLTRLQTTFRGGDSTDRSSYALGSGLLTQSSPGNVVVSNGQLYARQTSNATNSLVWAANGLARFPSTGYTVEFFVKLIEVSNNVAFGLNFTSVDCWNMAANWLTNGNWDGTKNPLYARASGWYFYVDSIDVFSRLANFTHVAYVSDASANGNLYLYVDGVKVAEVIGPLTKSSPYTGTVSLGGTAQNGITVDAYFSGVRVRRAQMYSGASFTPPTSPAAWGSP